MGLIEHSRIRPTRPWDLYVTFPDGRKARYHGGVFVEEREDGAIVLYHANASVEYRPGEYKQYFLDDIQESWYAAGKPGSEKWKLNVGKSRLPPNSSLRSRLLRIGEDGPHAFRDRFEDLLQNEERHVHTEPLRKFDRRERPAPELGSDYTEVCETIDLSTERITRKKAGLVVLEITNTISPDGRVLTATERAVTTDGPSVEIVFVYEKQ